MTRLNPLHNRTVNRFSKKFDHVDCLLIALRLDPISSEGAISLNRILHQLTNSIMLTERKDSSSSLLVVCFD